MSNAKLTLTKGSRSITIRGYIIECKETRGIIGFAVSVLSLTGDGFMKLCAVTQPHFTVGNCLPRHKSYLHNKAESEPQRMLEHRILRPQLMRKWQNWENVVRRYFRTVQARKIRVRCSTGRTDYQRAAEESNYYRAHRNISSAVLWKENPGNGAKARLLWQSSKMWRMAVTSGVQAKSTLTWTNTLRTASRTASRIEWESQHHVSSQTFISVIHTQQHRTSVTSWVLLFNIHTTVFKYYNPFMSTLHVRAVNGPAFRLHCDLPPRQTLLLLVPSLYVVVNSDPKHKMAVLIDDENYQHFVWKMPIADACLSHFQQSITSFLLVCITSLVWLHVVSFFTTVTPLPFSFHPRLFHFRLITKMRFCSDRSLPFRFLPP